MSIDFNNDGKIDSGEQYRYYQMINEGAKRGRNSRGMFPFMIKFYSPIIAIIIEAMLVNASGSSVSDVPEFVLFFGLGVLIFLVCAFANLLG